MDVRTLLARSMGMRILRKAWGRCRKELGT